MMEAKEMMIKAVEALDSKRAVDVEVLKTEGLTMLADYFIICTANSSTHIKTLSDEVERVLTELGEPPHHTEGYRAGGWVLIDFSVVVIHLFTEEMREFYSLERLWNDAERVDISSLIKPD